MILLIILRRNILNMGQKILNVLSFLSLFSISMNAYSETFIYKNTLNNKSIGVVNAIHQGDTSLWVAGEKGIFSVQGHVIKKVEVWDEEFGFEVKDLLEDERGRLWIASIGGGITIFDQIKGEVVKALNQGDLQDCWDLTFSRNISVLAACQKTIISVDMNSLESNDILEFNNRNEFDGITTVSIDNSERVWFSSLESSIYVLDLTKNTLKRTEYLKEDKGFSKVTDIKAGSEDFVWVATSGGGMRINSSTLEIDYYRLSEALDSSYIYKVEIINGDRVFFIGNTLYEVDLNEKKIFVSKRHFPTWENWDSGRINGIAVGKMGELLLATNLLGIVEFPSLNNSISFLVDEKGSKIGNLASTHLDNDQVLFSDGIDLYIYNMKMKSSTKIVKNVGYVNNSLTLNDGKILLALERKGFFVLNPNDWALNKLDSFTLGLPDSLHSETYGMGQAGDDAIYVGFFGDLERGLYLGRLDSGFEPLLSDLFIDEVFSDEQRHIVVATRKSGVFKFKGKKQIGHYKAENSQGDMITNCMKQARNGVIWLCTNGNGLAYLDEKTGKIHFVDNKYTSHSKIIRDLVIDNSGYLWLMTGNGLIRFDPQTYESIRLGKEDGIYDIDFEITASLKLTDDKILVAGDHYNYIIETQRMNAYLDKRAEMTTNVVMTSLDVANRAKRLSNNASPRMNRAIFGNNPLTFSYEEYLFTFKFAANNYIERDNLHFEYRLQGLSDNWQRTTPEEASATYSTLPHGTYTFQVRVIDQKSRSEQPVLSIPIIVSPPYWLTWQAYLVYSLLVISATYFAYWYRTRSLKKTNLYLASEIEERTKQLDLSNKVVNNLLNQKEQFFENLSHEFKTPIALILGPLEKLKASLKNEEEVESVKLIERNAHRLEGLVDQVLDLSKSSSVFNTTKVTYFIKQSLEMLVESFQPLVASKSQRLILNNDSNIKIELYADSFERVVTNLISNAIKYSPSGGTIEVSSFVKNKTYTLQVKDQGDGIPLDMQSKIFQRFTRLDRSRDAAGSGLGLAVTKDVVESNNGTIQLESEQGQGSVFTVKFPLTLESLGQTDSSHVTRISEEDDSEENLKKLLIVEDNPDMLEYILECLSDSFICEFAHNGAAGIDRANQSVPDLIITDLMMPVKGGFELVDSIRENEITSHIPIIVLTAKGDRDSRICGWNKNVDDYIAKPFVAEELIARVNRLFNIRDLIRANLADEVLSTGTKTNPIERCSFKSAKDKVFFERFVEVIEQGFSDEAFNRKAVASKLAISERQLNRKLSGLIDHNFSEFLRKYRLEKAKVLLVTGHQITNVSFDVGFSSPSYFTSCFKAEFGMTPKAYVEAEVEA